MPSSRKYANARTAAQSSAQTASSPEQGKRSSRSPTKRVRDKDPLSTRLWPKDSRFSSSIDGDHASEASGPGTQGNPIDLDVVPAYNITPSSPSRIDDTTSPPKAPALTSHCTPLGSSSPQYLPVTYDQQTPPFYDDEIEELLTPPLTVQESSSQSAEWSSQCAYDDDISPPVPKTAQPDLSMQPQAIEMENNIQLDETQAEVVDAILRGANVFYTGSAGCGKSTVLKAFVKRLEERNVKVDIVAPTGIAALNVNGCTTYNYVGLNLDHSGSSLADVRQLAWRQGVKERLSDTNVLVIDEISMVENFHLERLNAMMQEARWNNNAFGGVQLVVTGDFCQLPPVKPFANCLDCGKPLVPGTVKDEKGRTTEYNCYQHGVRFDIDKWAFRSAIWEKCNFTYFNLTQVHRQSDKQFISILNKLRVGVRLAPAEIDLLMNHDLDGSTANAIKIYPRKYEVYRDNQNALKALVSLPNQYICHDHFEFWTRPENIKKYTSENSDKSLEALNDSKFESTLILKQGMKVVLVHNIDQKMGLVNGSQGTILRFEEFDMKQLARPGGPPKSAPEEPIPGKYSDITHYKDVRLGAYVRAMDCRNYGYAEKRKKGVKWFPVVKFRNVPEPKIILPVTIVNRVGQRPRNLLSRTQIPLIPGYAITAHKSQASLL